MVILNLARMMFMKKFLTATALLFLFTAPAFAQGNWQVIFRGHATDRLRGYGMTKFPDSAWHVEDSVLVAQADAPNIDLVTRDKFKNFELMFEWRVTEAGNSGIFFHVVDTVKHESGNGNSPNWLNNFEMQILDDIGFNDTAAIRSAGSLYDLIAPEHKHLKPVGQWNTARLLVRGNHVEHWLNGDKVVSYEMNSPETDSLIAKSKYKDNPVFGKSTNGYIMFQHHGQRVGFKNIFIRKL